MTESEAKTKWCPAYRVATSGGDVSSTFETDNRPQQWAEPGADEPRGTPYKAIGLHEMGCCIASQCMAWRADENQPTRTYTNVIDQAGNAQHPDGDGWVKDGVPGWAANDYHQTGQMIQGWVRALPAANGYCGLAQ